jgi:hypothetical protein
MSANPVDLMTRPSAATNVGVIEQRVNTRETTFRHTPRWQYDLEDKLTALIRLPANWDSYGARTIDSQAAEMAARFLCLVLRDDAVLPKIVPTVRGNIQLEWYSDRAELEIEVGAQGPLTACFVDRRSREEWEREITADLGPIVGKISSCF